MRPVKINLPVRQAGTKNLVILFFSLFVTLAVFSQINAANPKPTSDVGLNWLYYKSNNDITAYLGKKSSPQPTVRYQKGNDYLEFSMTGVSSTTSISLETDVKTPNTPTLFYRNIFDGVDANYQITKLPFRVKEEIVLNQNRHPMSVLGQTFTFSAETSAKPVKQDDGSIAFFDGKGDYLFQLDKPFMYDAENNRSEAVTIEIIPKSEFLISNQIPSSNNQTNQNRHRMSVLGQTFDGNNQLFKQFKQFFPVLDLKNWNLFRNSDLEFRNFSNIRQNRHPMSVLEPQRYTLTLKADSEWLSTATYPVVIDPTITHNADANFTGQMNRIADSDTTSSTQLESSYPEATKDPHTVLLLHFNEANGATAGIRDYASTTRVITANGNASTTNYVTQLGLGNSAAFDGTGDYLSIPGNNDFYFTNTGSLSIDFWVKLNATNRSHGLIGGTTWSGSADTDWMIDWLSSNQLRFQKYSSGPVASISQDTNWHHIAVTGIGGSFTLYFDGISVATSNISSAWGSQSTNLLIGTGGAHFDIVDSNYLNGYLDSLRILKGRALTPEEIKAAASRRPYAVYTSPVVDAAASVAWNTVNWTEGGVNTGDGETLYNSSSLVAQWNFNETSGTTATSSTSGSCQTCAGTLNGFSYTASQDQATTTTGWTANNKKWGAGALMMESAAAADYVSITDPASNALDPGTGDFTIEGWIKSSTVGQDTIIQNNTTVGACATNAGYILIVNGNRNLAAYASDGTTCFVNNLTANASSTEIADGRWHHFAFVADRDTKAYVYYDGRLATSTTISNTTAANPAATLYLGASGATGDSDFILDSMRYYSRALSAAEVLSNSQAGNIEIQTRTGATSDPNDGTWEAWKPTTGETQLLSMDSDAANWRSDIMASTTIATSTDTTLKMEGTGSLKVKMGMASTTAGTVALWHFEETGTTTGTYLYDETANNNDATTTGTTVVDGIFGKARSFDGVDDNLTVPDSANWNFGTGDFSIDTWVKLNTVSAICTILGQRPDADNFFAFAFNQNSATGLEFRIKNATVITVNLNQGNTLGWTANNWYHVAATRRGNNWNLYRNGESIASLTDTDGFSDLAGNLIIGAQGSLIEYCNGIIDEPRILKGRALSADEIAETYRMGANHHLTRQVSATDLSAQTKLAFWIAADRPGTGLETMLGESDYANYELASSTLALSTTTVLYIKGDEIASSTSIKDSSFSGKAITANGNARTSGGGKIGNSVYFDGTGDYLSLADSADWDFGSGNFSVDFWINWVGNTTEDYIYYQIDSGIPTLMISSQASGFNVGASNASAWDVLHPAIFQSTTLPTVGKWYHFALVRDGSTARMFVNGAQEGTASMGTTALRNSTGSLFIASESGTASYVSGYLDEFRVIKGTALSADQIRQAYEYGLRSHQITIDFGATLQTSDLISNSTDYNFTLTATTSGLSATTSGLYLGDKIIIKENLGGTEYTAQGTVNAINTTTGAITVPSWDTGSTFPASNGYSPNATVFKWQREYFDLGGAATTTRNAITNLTLRPTNGGGGRTVWLDDFRYNTNYLTASSSSAITSSNNRYLQYRTIFSSWDSFVSPYLSAINTLYSSTANMFGPLIGVSGGGFLSF